MSAPRYDRSPSPMAVGFPMHRRSVLKGILGAAGVAAVPGLAACGSSDKGSESSASKDVTFGSNYSDAGPKKYLREAFDKFTADSGVKVTVNDVDHGAFQDNISNYLQGSPQDVFTWFAGFRMRYFARQNLATDISDVWADSAVGGKFSDALKAASTGDDGKQYFIPFYNYPWAFFYRKSLWAAKGYTAPKTWDELITLLKKMKADGLAPVSLGEKDGWPALGTFDYLNMRLNGYQFHIDLCGGKQSWTDPKVAAVFDKWKELSAYYEEGYNGRTWQEAAASLQKKTTGMYLLGSFVQQEFTDANKDDVAFFPFPEMDPANGIGAVEAPIDGFMMSKKVKNKDNGKKLLKFLASAGADDIYAKGKLGVVGANKDANTSDYNQLQKDSQALIANAKNISQFFDRDADPKFVGVFIPQLQAFLKNPKDISSILTNLEKQKTSIYTS
jgi:multiple sugar transport system substrate-binding protein